GLFLTHGEDDGRAALRDLLVEKGLARRHIHLPQLDDVVDLVGQRSPRKRLGPHRLPPKIAGRTDWHNDYAQFILDLQQALSEESDDKDRRTMLRRLRKAAKLSR
ncbi:MAG: MBL fold metallo-hydrolase, partial [Rhodospirillaceae bacterium]|nr:MBL fold metallo-hydrolase [Rhodospirillaceae bacterium]